LNTLYDPDNDNSIITHIYSGLANYEVIKIVTSFEIGFKIPVLRGVAITAS